jgi:hypothetical protein
VKAFLGLIVSCGLFFIAKNLTVTDFIQVGTTKLNRETRIEQVKVRNNKKIIKPKTLVKE